MPGALTLVLPDGSAAPELMRPGPVAPMRICGLETDRAAVLLVGGIRRKRHIRQYPGEGARGELEQ
jgi:hypothetical protein